MTPKMRTMLRRADEKSLPGDGLRIKGPGQHQTARALEALGFVRVARPAAEHMKAHVHITPAGRREIRGGEVRPQQGLLDDYEHQLRMDLLDE